MQASGQRALRLALCAFAASLLLVGCGGNKLITNRNGLVWSGELVLDSIPRVPAGNEYIIGQGDILDVVFPFNRDFNQLDVRVRPDGRISLAHIGEVVAAGMTASSLDSFITERYAEILVDPNVAIIVKQFERQLIYVLGEVATPGGFPYERGMTLLTALALGRGPTPKGASGGVLVVRKIGPAHIVGIQIDYGDIVDGKRFALDVPLQAGDIVLVPKSKLGKAQDFTEMLYDIIWKPADLYLKGWQVSHTKVMYEYYRRIGQL